MRKDLDATFCPNILHKKYHDQQKNYDKAFDNVKYDKHYEY